VARHIFQACPVWIYTQSNITNMTEYVYWYLRIDKDTTIPEEYKDNLDVSSEEPFIRMLIAATNFPTKWLRSKRRRFPCIFHVVTLPTPAQIIFLISDKQRLHRKRDASDDTAV
jgi:hypothetical protein